MTTESNAARKLGENIQKADWLEARNAVSDRGATNGRVTLPKPNGEYAGKVVFITETHLVQQVGKNAAVAHDLRLLENGRELGEAYDQNKVQAGITRMLVRYDAAKGKAEVVPFNVQRATEVRKQGEVWASKSISNVKARQTFMSHLDKFTTDIARGQTQAARTESARQDRVKPPEKTKER